MCGFHRSGLLCGIEFGWHGDDNASPIVDASVGCKSLDDFGRELLRSEVPLEVLADVHFNSSHGALELLENVSRGRTSIPCLGGTDHLTCQFVGGRIANVNDTLTVDRHDRRRRILLRAAFLDDRDTILHDGDGRVGRAEVNAPVDLSIVVHIK